MLEQPMMEKLIGHASSRHGGGAEDTGARPGGSRTELPGTARDCWWISNGTGARTRRSRGD